MTDDDRFERLLAAAVHEGSPEAAPPALRQRVEASLRVATARRSAGRKGFVLAAAAGVAVVLIGSVIVSTRHTPSVPGASQPGSGVAATDTHSPATAAATAPSIAEPITDPGQVQVGQLITATDGWVHNTDGHLFFTHSGGAAWRDITPPGLRSDILRPFFIDGLHGWLSEYDDAADTGLVVWRTTDSGATWSRFGVPDIKAVNWDLVFLTPMVGWLASDPGGEAPKPELRWTGDGGATWSAPIDLAVATGLDTLQLLTFADREHGFMTGENLFRSTDDGGMTWSDVLRADLPDDALDAGVVLDYGVPTLVDASHGFLVIDVIGPDGTFRTRLIYTTAGSAWRLALRDDLRRHWSFVDASTWIGIDDGHVWTTVDSGATFDVQSSTGLPKPLLGAWMTFVDPAHGMGAAIRNTCPGGTLSCPVMGAELFATSDGGKTWTRVGDCLFTCESTEPP